MHVNSKKHLEKKQAARDLADDDNLEGASSQIIKKPIEASEENKKEENDTTALTEEDYIAEKVRNAHKFELNECLICPHSSTGFDEYVSPYKAFHTDRRTPGTSNIWPRSTDCTFLTWSSSQTWKA